MSAISPSFDQRSSSAKSALADVRSFIKVGQENSTSIELYYEDRGSGPLRRSTPHSWSCSPGSREIAAHQIHKLDL
jgi:hypothetical protein